MHVFGRMKKHENAITWKCVCWRGNEKALKRLILEKENCVVKWLADYSYFFLIRMCACVRFFSLNYWFSCLPEKFMRIKPVSWNFWSSLCQHWVFLYFHSAKEREKELGMSQTSANRRQPLIHFHLFNFVRWRKRLCFSVHFRSQTNKLFALFFSVRNTSSS